MNTQKKIILLFATLFAFGCGDSAKPQFPPVKKSSDMATDFLPTLEHVIPQNKNAVYAATMLFAWNEIRTELKNPIVIKPIFKDLYLLNLSNSFLSVLKPDEYETSTIAQTCRK